MHEFLHPAAVFGGFYNDACAVVRAGAKQDVTRTLDSLALAPAYARAVNQREASDIADVGVRAGGVYFSGAGWVRPATLVQAQLAQCGVRLVTHYEQQVAAVRRGAAHAGAMQEWELLDDASQVPTVMAMPAGQ